MLIEGFLVGFVVLIGAIFLVLGVLLLKSVGTHLWDVWSAFFEALSSRDWSTTAGKSVRAVVRYTTGRGGRVHTPAVRYEYGADGERFVSDRYAFATTSGIGEEGLVAAQAVVQRFRAGSTVEVHYDPRNPKRATLDRSLPPVVGPTLGWLFVLLFGGGLFLFLGVTIVRGPFEDPPNLGDVPPLGAQIGGFAAAIGALLVLVSGVRAVRTVERTERRLLRYLRAAKPALVREAREGELVAISGRVEELEIENADSIELPFEKGALVYYDADAESFRRTCFSDFGVRDASGSALVELREAESTFLPSRRWDIEGEVECWLDEQRESPDEPVPAQLWLTLQRIRKGDPVVLVGRAERDDDDLVFRANAADPTSLLVADGSREEVVERLGKRLRWTRVLFLLGGGLIAVGVVAKLL